MTDSVELEKYQNYVDAREAKKVTAQWLRRTVGSLVVLEGRINGEIAPPLTRAMMTFPAQSSRKREIIIELKQGKAVTDEDNLYLKIHAIVQFV